MSIVFALFLVLSSSAAPVTDKAKAGDIAQSSNQTQTVKSTKPKKVCRTDKKETGSRIAKRICKTEEEWQNEVDMREVEQKARGY